jgi:DNA primase
MPLIDLRQARREIRLSWVLGLLGWHEREQHGEQVRGACPLHGSTAPRSRSFSAHLGRGIWQCFRCGASGNALDLWAKVTGQGLYPSVLDLYDRLGQSVPWLCPVRAANHQGEKADVVDRPRA